MKIRKPTIQKLARIFGCGTLSYEWDGQELYVFGDPLYGRLTDNEAALFKYLRAYFNGIPMPSSLEF